MKLHTRRLIAAGVIGGGSPPVLFTTVFRDLFSTDAAGGAVNGTAAEPGPGNRAVTDAAGRLTISGGECLIADGGTSSNPRLTYDPVTIAAGHCFAAVARLNQDASEAIQLRIGFDEAATGTITAPCWDFASTTGLQARWGSSSVQLAGAYTRLTNYKLVIMFLPNQARWFVKGGAWADWTQIHSQAASWITNSLYPAYNAYNRNGAADSIGVYKITTPKYLLDTMIMDGGLKKAFDSFFSLPELTASQVSTIMVNSGSTVAIEKTDADNYWLVQDLDGVSELRFRLHNNGNIYCIDSAYIYEGTTKTEDLFTWGSVLEYAFNDGTYGWMGNGHGQDYQTALTFQVDGQTVTPSNGERVTGAAVTIMRVSEFHQTNAEGLKLAGCTTVYTLSPTAGLSTQITVDWDITPVTGLIMFPLDHRFSRGAIVGLPGSMDMSVGDVPDTDITGPTVSSSCAYLWEYGGNWAAMLQVSDGHNRNTYLQDRGNEGEKIYTNEAGTNLGGNIRQFSSNYRVKYLTDADETFLGT